MKRRHWLSALAVVAASAGAAGEAEAADISVSVSDSFITSKIDTAINSYIQSQVSEFAWLAGVTRVETFASGVDGNTLHIRLNLTFDASVLGVPAVVPVDIDFDVVLDCNANGPFALIDELEATTLVPVRPEIERAIQTEANRMLAARTQAIIGPIWTQLGGLPANAIARQVCPHFEVSSQGALYVEVDFRNGCINGRTKVRACGARYTGDGYRYLCVNGYWERASGYCEPAAPPGGQRP
ncbi:MAG TPA: hypothetical protein VI072_06090 [Polyangiaceae bacterium]